MIDKSRETKILSDKIEKMSPQEFEIFMSSQIQEVKSIENEINENYKKMEDLKASPKTKELTERQTTLICTASIMTCLIAGGALGVIFGDAKPGCGDLGVVSGVIAGIPAMFANVNASEKKPFSNYLYKIKARVLEDKNKKLESQKKQIQSLISIADCGVCK